MFATVVIACLLSQTLSGIMASSPYQPRAKGEAVVQETVEIIEGLKIFPSDHKFLCRIAWVESKYGQDSGTYRSGYHGGIWQVDKIGYAETVKQQGLKKYWKAIKEKLDIDWVSTTWNDLEKPLYSGLAARLFLARLASPIPSDLDSQARYWKTHYNSIEGKGTVEKFIKDVQSAKGCAK